jgi:hypothetical protein
VETEKTAVQPKLFATRTAVACVFTAVFLHRGFDRFLKPKKRSDFSDLLKPRLTAVLFKKIFRGLLRRNKTTENLEQN